MPRRLPNRSHCPSTPTWRGVAAFPTCDPDKLYGYRVQGPYDPVKMMPVHHHAYDRHLVERGPSNYWGYNTQALFAPDIARTAGKKHNESNGDNHSDGDGGNLSWNCGVEGPTSDPNVIKLREQQKRNLMASLLLSSAYR